MQTNQSWSWKTLVIVPLIAGALTWGALSVHHVYQVKSALVRIVGQQQQLIQKQNEVIVLQELLIRQLEETLESRRGSQLVLR